MKHYQIRQVTDGKDGIISYPLGCDTEGHDVVGYGVYLNNPDGTQKHVADCATLSEAEVYVENLISSWIETHHEIVSILSHYLQNYETCPKLLAEKYINYGRCAMYTYGEELTDKFETLNLGREWDGEFFDEIDAFCTEEFNRGGLTVEYENHYICPICGEEWWDHWDCMCNDRCPKCNAEIEPTDSELITE